MVFRTENETNSAVPTPGFGIPPYHVEDFPIGSCVCNKNGFNCLSFTALPGAKFTSKEQAERIADRWNSENLVG